MFIGLYLIDGRGLRLISGKRLSPELSEIHNLSEINNAWASKKHRDRWAHFDATQT